MSNAYKKAGVDVEKGYEAVDRMKKHIKKTNRPEVIGGVGAFAGLFELTKFNYEEPVLVSGTDGVGTKLMLAFQQQKHDTVGIDLVAMCVNDIAAQGAKPLFFLDYIGCGQNDPHVMEEIVSGVATGCVESGAALIGGETAEMPGMYKTDEYDLAGFTVGIAEKAKLITGESIQAGDTIIGIASSGLHANGFSLVRHVIKDMDLNKVYDGFTESLGNTLLTPTKIYTKAIEVVMENNLIKGIAHITGGGFYENFPRVLPKGLGVALDISQWEQPHIFQFIQEKGNLTNEDMYGTFNMGIGMALIVAKEEANAILKTLTEIGETATIIGQTTASEGVQFTL